MKKLLKGVAASALAISLAACHSTPPADQQAQATVTNMGAKTYGLGQKGGLTGSEVNGGGMNGVHHRNDLRAPANQVYYFGFDESALHSDDLYAATVQAKYLLEHPHAKVRLEGNTDDRGSREYNVALGYRRAQNVASVLKQHGVKASQIRVVSYGKEHPAVVGEDEHAWSLNRRVELIYVQK